MTTGGNLDRRYRVNRKQPQQQEIMATIRTTIEYETNAPKVSSPLSSPSNVLTALTELVAFVGGETTMSTTVLAQELGDMPIFSTKAATSVSQVSCNGTPTNDMLVMFLPAVPIKLRRLTTVHAKGIPTHSAMLLAMRSMSSADAWKDKSIRIGNDPGEEHIARVVDSAPAGPVVDNVSASDCEAMNVFVVVVVVVVVVVPMAVVVGVVVGVVMGVVVGVVVVVAVVVFEVVVVDVVIVVVFVVVVGSTLQMPHVVSQRPAAGQVLQNDVSQLLDNFGHNAASSGAK